MPVAHNTNRTDTGRGGGGGGGRVGRRVGGGGGGAGDVAVRGVAWVECMWMGVDNKGREVCVCVCVI